MAVVGFGGHRKLADPKTAADGWSGPQPLKS